MRIPGELQRISFARPHTPCISARLRCAFSGILTTNWEGMTHDNGIKNEALSIEQTALGNERGERDVLKVFLWPARK